LAQVKFFLSFANCASYKMVTISYLAIKPYSSPV
jgi:hypothetical protein